ncbi:MAG: hypothetical protein D6705_00565 [Deltaproteobacteria bacterium]|nr:MAG: hypothetical protein D6705_00565 [Deltaproteobacteria bacterium]
MWGLLLAGAVTWGAPQEATSASGEKLPVFSWDAPTKGCPTESEVRRRLEARLAEASPTDETVDVAAVARVRRTDDGAYELRLWTAERGVLRERRLTDVECEVLADAAVLLTVLARHPSARSGDPKAARLAAAAEEREEPTPPPRRLDPSQRDEDESSRHEPPPPPAHSIEGRAGVGLGVAFGALPGTGPALRVEGAFELRLRARFGLRFEFPITYEVERRGRFSDRPDAGADLHLVASGISTCAVGRLARVHLPACAGVEAGAIVGRGVGVAEPRTDAVAWVAIPVRGGVDVLLGRHVVLAFALEGVFPVLRTVFVVEGLGDVFRPAPAALRAFAGVGARW